jgi:RNase P subunit RPR2
VKWGCEPIALSDNDRTLKAMTTSHSSNHEHTVKTTRVLGQRAGVPYELERTVCEACRKLLTERSLRRAAA